MDFFRRMHRSLVKGRNHFLEYAERAGSNLEDPMSIRLGDWNERAIRPYELIEVIEDRRAVEERLTRIKHEGWHSTDWIYLAHFIQMGPCGMRSVLIRDPEQPHRYCNTPSERRPISTH